MENGRNFLDAVQAKARLAIAVAAMMTGGCTQDYKMTPGDVGPMVDECNDGVDNDMDGEVDGWDQDCASAWDVTEGADPEEAPYVDYETRECGDSADNDGDGWRDQEDPGCWAEVITNVDGQAAEVYTYLAGDDDESREGYQE